MGGRILSRTVSWVNGIARWDSRLLFQPLNTIPPRQRVAVAAVCTLLTAGWSWSRNANLRYAWTLPDVMYYVDMAKGRYDLVPAPFSARPLAPLLAHVVSSLTHGSVESGFACLAALSLLFALAAVFGLAVRTSAPRCTLLLLAAVPFWPQLLGNAGLPDPLYAALIAGLLLALHADRLHLCAALMLPLMLARESTWLALLCLLAVTWPGARRPRVGLLALGCAAAGALLVRHLSAGGLPNPEHLPGALYMAGKLLANTARSFGLTPWSNVYPELCSTPAWQATLHLGPVRSIGVCQLSSEGPLEAVSGGLTVFAVLPLLALLLPAARRLSLGRTSVLTRFCILYGAISFLLAPSLGTWYTRLFGYGWPLFLVALPRLLGDCNSPTGPGDLSDSPEWLTGGAAPWGLLVVVHLVICGLSLLPLSRPVLAGVGLTEVAVSALFVVQLRRLPKASPAD